MNLLCLSASALYLKTVYEQVHTVTFPHWNAEASGLSACHWVYWPTVLVCPLRAAIISGVLHRCASTTFDWAPWLSRRETHSTWSENAAAWRGVLQRCKRIYKKNIKNLMYFKYLRLFASPTCPWSQRYWRWLCPWTQLTAQPLPRYHLYWNTQHMF